MTLPPFQHVRSIHDWWLVLTAAVLQVLLSLTATGYRRHGPNTAETGLAPAVQAVSKVLTLSESSAQMAYGKLEMQLSAWA